MFKVRAGPNGIHLFARSTGLNILLDEVSVPESNWSLAPRSVSIALTNVCDFECSYCYAPKHQAMLALPSILEWCVDLDANGCFGIGFGGGEPTLFPRLASLCTEIAAQTSLAVSITTHGHRFTREFGDPLRGKVHFLRVSVDGVGSTYERLRGRSFATLRERINVIRDIAPFGVNCVVNADTVGELSSVAEFADEMGARELLLLPQHDGGTSALDRRTQESLSSWVEENYRARRIAVSSVGSDIVESPMLQTSETPDRDYAHIDADGALKRCSFDRRGIKIIEAGGILPAIKALQESSANKNLLRKPP